MGCVLSPSIWWSLYKQGIPLPSNSTQLYNYLTICRHLAKSGHPLDNTITDLDKLTELYKTLVKQTVIQVKPLEGINNNHLIFTLEEMRACPSLRVHSMALDCCRLFSTLGLLMTFNFVHFSIQEFLSAYHITQLPPCKYLKFWSNIHSIMFTMYTSLTKRYALNNFSLTVTTRSPLLKYSWKVN